MPPRTRLTPPAIQNGVDRPCLSIDHFDAVENAFERLPPSSRVEPPDPPASASRLQVLRVIERLVSNRRHLDREALGEILHLELAPLLAIGPWQIGERYVLADGRPVGD